MVNIIKGIRLLFFGLLVFSLFTAQTICAQEGEYMQGGQTAGIGPFFEIVSNTIYWVIGGLAALFLTTFALQWLINNQTQLINFSNGFTVQGLHITQGLSDMLLLLAFVAVAMGIIFKYRDFEAKKMLPKLIAVAILTRFGPLAVKMMVDIGNVAMNTIVGSNDKLLWTVTNTLMSETIKDILSILGMLAGSMVLYSIPWANIGALATTIAIFGVAAAGGPILTFAFSTIVKWIFELFVSYILAGVFLTYIVLFVSRIFMLQILTVVSPLAILSYALPQTKNNFTKWRDSLFSWSFVGVWTLFFLVLGIGSSSFILSDKLSAGTAGTDNGLLSGIGVDNYMLYYLFLIVYLSLVQSMAQKDAAMGAMFRATMLGGGIAAYTHMVQPAAGKANEYAIKKYIGAQSRIDAAKEAGIEPNSSDRLAMHASGLAANLTNSKTLAGMRSIFSGDEGKINTATSTGNKGWKPSKMTNIESQVSAKISEMGKDLSWEKTIAKGVKVDDMEAMVALKQGIGKKDQMANVQTLLGNLGPERATAIVGTMLKNNLLDANQTQSLAINNLDILVRSPKLIDKINSQDFNNKQSNNIRALFGPGLDENVYKENIARAMALKGAAFNKNALENLPANIFDDQLNRLGLLANATTQTFGNLNQINRFDDYEKLGAHINGMNTTEFTRLAQINPQLIKGMARQQDLNRFIPDYYKKDGKTNGDIDMDKLNQTLDAADKVAKASAAQTPTAAQPKTSVRGYGKYGETPSGQTAQSQQTPPRGYKKYGE
jgi:hypothetical protein